MPITKSDIIRAAADLANKNGQSGVSLKTVAQALGIRAPSLYNHIDGLDALFQEVARSGMVEMNSAMAQCAIGKAGDSAVLAVSSEYFKYVSTHPGVYEIIQWATWHTDSQTSKIFEDYKGLLATLVRSCGFDESNIEDILNMLTALLHGYTTMQLGFAIKNPTKAMDNMHCAVDTLLTGAHKKYGGNFSEKV